MNKGPFYVLAFLLIPFLVIACTTNAQTVEVTPVVQPTLTVVQDMASTPTVEVMPIVQPTLTVVQGTTPFEADYPAPSPSGAYLGYPGDMTPIPTATATFTITPFIKSTQRAPTLTAQQVSEKIAACYPRDGTGCSACALKENNSVQHVHSTSRMFINVPKDLYPMELFPYITIVKGHAAMGWISNGGLPGYGMDGGPNCWSTYVETDGQGEVELRIPSILIGVPDYYVRFIVE